MRGLVISIMAVWLSCAGVLTAGAQVTAPQGTTMTQQATININTATQAQLETLPSVGAVTAKNIIDYRTANGNFKSVDELNNVLGIGPKKLDRMKAFITVQ